MNSGGMIAAVGSMLLGYALGALNAAYYLVRRRQGGDIRALGSGNAGATNAGRVLGMWGFLLVFGLDAAKGALAVAWASQFSTDAWTVTATLWATVAGHIWPVQLGFRGGKGVSTTLGGLAMIDGMILGVIGALFLPAFAVLRRFAASGLLALAGCPVVLMAIGLDQSKVAGTFGLAALVWFAHRRDLRSLFGRRLGKVRASALTGTASPDVSS